MKNKLAASPEEIEWRGDRTPQQAYSECERGDWLLRMAAQRGVNRKLIVLAACDCAETVSYLASDEAKEVIRVTRLWCKRKAPWRKVRKATNAATYDRNSANAAATNAAKTAEPAAYDAEPAVFAATSAAYAAANAAVFDSVFYALSDYSKVVAMKFCNLADVVRARISFEVFRWEPPRPWYKRWGGSNLQSREGA